MENVTRLVQHRPIEAINTKQDKKIEKGHIVSYFSVNFNSVPIDLKCKTNDSHTR